ncbi:MAG: peptide chain release factor 2 [Acidobacteriota bacterium]|nr:peptide chain release factor 2 [Acidobacteriota bacterium]MDH3786465.1 peptide chain release factor 2 [Acidobacteriota bacterium]
MQELSDRLEALSGKVDTLRRYFDVDGNKLRLDEIEQRLTQPEVWGDPEESKKIQRQRSRLVERIEAADHLGGLRDDGQTFIDLAREGEDVVEDLQATVAELEKLAETIELETLLVGEHDAGNAIVEIHPGAGGTESLDWAAMLFRMYRRWADRRGFKLEVLDHQPGEEAGIKSVTMSVSGANAYGYLRVERGVHRLVRISPFDAQARRHTSFASLDVLPEIEEAGEVEIDDKDLRVDTFRASGAGGQHVNKTDSAVRMTHLPTNVVVTCQNERSQHRNKEVAMQVLRSKLFDLQQREADAKMAKEVGEKKEIAFGNQIRSYVLAPYRMVKDHRTQFEVGDADRVLDGDLDGFIRSALSLQRTEAAEEQAS